MSFRDHGVALVHRVDNLEDDVRARDRTIDGLRRRLAGTSEARWRRASIALGVFALLAGVLALRTVLRPIAEAAAQRGPIARWEGAAPLHVDTDGDGRPELIGPVRDRDDLHWIAAIDGDELAFRWRIGPLDPHADRHLAQLGPTTLVVAEGTRARLMSTADGSETRRVELPEPARELCAHPREAAVWVRGLERHHLLRADGSLEPALRPGWCQAGAVKRAPGVTGIDAQEALVEGTTVVTLGRDRDSGAATVVGSKVGDGQARWRHVLHTELPLEAGRHAVLHGGRAFVAAMHEGDAKVVAIDAATGELLWQRAATVDGDLRAVSVEADRVAVSVGGRLLVFDATSGQRLAALGG